MYGPVGIFNLTYTKNVKNNVGKLLFSAGKYLYRTYVKLKVEEKYAVDII
jgi:hypothetical protein